MRICEALVEKVSNLQSERRFDVIAFTGDVSYSGATEEFEVAKLNLIAPLISACHLSVAEVLIVPGNHDVNRSMIDTYSETGMQKKLASDPREIDLLIANASAMQSVIRPGFCREQFVSKRPGSLTRWSHGSDPRTQRAARSRVTRGCAGC